MKHIFIFWLACGLGFLGCDRGPTFEITKTKAEAGDVQAQNNLGQTYFFGAGVGQDNIAAYAWTSLAETNGYAKARQNNGNIAKEMTLPQIVEAKELFQKLQKQFDGNGTAPSE